MLPNPDLILPTISTPENHDLTPGQAWFNQGKAEMAGIAVSLFQRKLKQGAYQDIRVKSIEQTANSPHFQEVTLDYPATQNCQFQVIFKYVDTNPSSTAADTIQRTSRYNPQQLSDVESIHILEKNGQNFDSIFAYWHDSRLHDEVLLIPGPPDFGPVKQILRSQATDQAGDSEEFVKILRRFAVQSLGFTEPEPVTT